MTPQMLARVAGIDLICRSASSSGGVGPVCRRLMRRRRWNPARLLGVLPSSGEKSSSSSLLCRPISVFVPSRMYLITASILLHRQRVFAFPCTCIGPRSSPPHEDALHSRMQTRFSEPTKQLLRKLEMRT